MYVITGNRRMWYVSAAISLILFLVVYFTIIRPDNNAANAALKSGLQQSQQVLNQAQTQLSRAAKLTACVQAAGTDPSKLAGCQAKFGG